MNPSILIAGIGSIFLGDDAFGPEMVRHLEKMAWPSGVQIHDFGIRSLDLAWRLLDPWDLVVLVDAAARGHAPGSVYHVDLSADTREWARPQALTTNTQPFDGHRAGVADVLRLLHEFAPAAATPRSRLHLVGCEPQSFEPASDGDVLTDTVAAAVPIAIDLIRSLVAELVLIPSPEVIPS